jgi:alpha-galactosidase
MHWNRVLRIACFSFTLVLAGALRAQSVQYFEKEKLWVLSTDHNSYVLAVGPHGELRHLYWGLPVQREGDLTPLGPVPDISSFDPSQMLINEEYPGWGGPFYEEPALKITREDGDRDLVLRCVSHRIQQNDLEIELKDIRDSIEVTLHYRIYPRYGIVRRYATIRNGTNQPLTIESAQSAAWYLPHGTGYQLTYLSGRWAAEMQINHEPIHQGVYGARMTGGGFGGCTINLVNAEAVEDFQAKVASGYERATGRKPEVYVCAAADGVRRVM